MKIFYKHVEDVHRRQEVYVNLLLHKVFFYNHLPTEKTEYSDLHKY